MYFRHFGLERPPYKLTPDTDLFYAGAARGDILDALVYAVVSGEAITKVVGEVGSGKTMLCRMLEHKLPRNVEVVYLANPSLSPNHVLYAIALELGLSVAAGDDRWHVMKALQEYLLQRHAENRQIVVFIEEAQAMPLATLEEIRLLSNLETHRHKLLQVVLFGQPELDAELNASHVRQIKERITNSFYLSPLHRWQIRDYLMFRLRLVGFRGADIFSHAAIWLTGLFSGGLIRRVNIIADKAMLAAYTDESRTVRAHHVIAALRDSEFIHRRRWKPAVLLAAPWIVLCAVVAGWTLVSAGTATARPGTAAAAPAITRVEAAPTITRNAGDDGKPAASNDAPAELLAATKSWLPEINPAHFTIQMYFSKLKKATDLTSIDDFLQQESARKLGDRLFIYRNKADGRAPVTLLYGDFEDYSSAAAALKSLPTTLRLYQPFIRNVPKVNAES